MLAEKAPALCMLKGEVLNRWLRLALRAVVYPPTPFYVRLRKRSVAVMISCAVPGAVAVKPVELARGQKEDAAQDQRPYAFGVGFGVGQCQRAASRAAKKQSAIDAQVPAQDLQVFDETPGGVVVDTSMWPAAPRAPLIGCGKRPGRKSAADWARSRYWGRHAEKRQGRRPGCQRPRNQARALGKRAESRCDKSGCDCHKKEDS